LLLLRGGDDDVMNALFRSEAKRFLLSFDGF